MKARTSARGRWRLSQMMFLGVFLPATTILVDDEPFVSTMIIALAIGMLGGLIIRVVTWRWSIEVPSGWTSILTAGVIAAIVTGLLKYWQTNSGKAPIYGLLMGIVAGVLFCFFSDAYSFSDTAAGDDDLIDASDR